MVNNNFRKFNQEQKKHIPAYLGNDKLENLGGFNKSDYNSQEDTDKSIGAAGRNESLS